MKYFVYFATIIEILMAFLSGGDARVTLNYQCVNGGIATAAILPASFICSQRRHSKLNWSCLFILTLCSLYSSTRGYMLIVVPITILTVFFYMPPLYTIMTGFISIFAVLVILLFKESWIVEAINKVIIITRIEETGGYRNIENLLSIKIFMHQFIGYSFIGNGFGCLIANMENAQQYLFNLNINSWLRNRTLYAYSLHNQWINLILSGGIIMFFFTAIACIRLIVRTNYIVRDRKFKRIMLIYIFLYIICNCYRYTFTAGVLELTVYMSLLSYYKYFNKKTGEIHDGFIASVVDK